MLRFFLIFFLTLVIGFFSPILTLVAKGFLLSLGRVHSLVSLVVYWGIELVPALIFIRWHARKQGPAWAVWITGFLGLVVGNLLYRFLFSFGVAS